MDRKVESENISSPLIPADTTPDAYHKQREIWFSKSPGERLKLGLQMMDDVKALMEAGIRNRNPGISAVNLKIEWFKLMYKEEFSNEELEKIFESFRKWHSENDKG